MYHDTLLQIKKMLANLDKCLEKASAYASAKKVEPAVMVGLRLAPDQFALARQVQITCDTAKLGMSRVTGKDAPSHPDTEQDIDGLRARIASTLAYLDGFSESDFDGADTRVVTQPRWEGKWMSGRDFLREHAIPNFYFHLAHTYAILRNNGVELGKRDYLGAMSFNEG